MSSLKAWHRCAWTCKNDKKPIDIGIKVYALAESKTGYTFNFLMDIRDGLTVRDMVLGLVNPLGPGHVVYMDNYFTSVR